MKHILEYNEFLNEGFNPRNKDTEIFNYSSIIDNTWRPKIIEAQKFQGINFDLENNDSTKEKRGIGFPALLRKDQPIKYTYECELCVAGGDWENPVYYFKIESTYSRLTNSEYAKNPEYIFDTIKIGTNDDYNKWVFIPPKKAGNLNLTQTDKGTWTATTEEDSHKIDTKPMWNWLEKTLQEIVNKRHKRLDL